MEGKQKTLLVLPTGTGKTVVFAEVAKRVADNGNKTLVLAHRGELLDQAIDKIGKVADRPCALEKAESTSMGSDEPIVVGSVQTLSRESRLCRFDPAHFNCIIVDEAHHAISDSYRRIIDYFKCAYVLGVTATPNRGDRKTLATVFDSIAYEYTLPRAIADGYLCKIMAQTIPLRLDISNVGLSAGDFKADEIGTALDPYLEQIASEMVACGCADRKTVVFLPLVSTAKKFTEILNAHGLRACEVDGKSEDRAEIISAFENDEYDVLCNSMLLTEGWDCPSVDCIVVLRPTRSTALYQQMVGRGTRLHEGKDHLLLLDFLWMTEKHELCHPASLITGNDTVASKMTEKLAENGEARDLEELEEEAERDVKAEREAALAEELREMRHRKGNLVDPLQFEMSIMDAELTDYVPCFSWEVAKPTEKQLETLEKFGIDPSGIESKGKATMFIDRMIKRCESGLSTPKQIRFLEQRGFKDVGMWTKDQAGKMIGRISKNGWRVPYGIIPANYIPPKEADEKAVAV